MPESGEIPPPNRTTRPEGGFDRFDAGARDGWAVLWRSSSRGRFIMGRDRSIWLWDAQVKQWKRLSSDQEAIALRDHERAMNRLRRSLLALRTLESKLRDEREAARLAMQRLASAIVGEWRRAGHADIAVETSHWFDHPAGIYLAATRDCRNHFPEELRQPFDIKLFAALVRESYDDVKAGRRVQPPKLRAEDMALLHLQTREQEAAATPPDLTDFMQDFRQTISDDFERSEHAGKKGMSRWSLVIAGLVLLIGLAGLVGYVLGSTAF